MGYFVNLIREERGIERKIEREELMHHLSSDAKLSYDDMGNYLNIKKISAYGNPVYFIYQNGELYVKNPSEIQLEEFILLAKSMGGRVRGEYFETYRSSSETYVHENDKIVASKCLEEINNNVSNRNEKNYL